MELYQNRDPIRRQNSTAKPENPNKTQHTGPTASRDRCFTVAVVCVFLLCFVLLIATTVLWIKYSIQTAEKEELQTRHDAFIIDRDQLRSRYKLLLISYGKMILERDSLMERNENLMINKEELQNSTAELQKKLNDFEKQEEQKWKKFNSSFYYISETKNWTDSKVDCEQRGGHLVVINSWDEQKFINDALGKSHAWIGLTDTQNEKEWKWVDGTMMTNSYWRSGEPNGNMHENCVEIYQPEGRLSWNDYNCSYKAAWICEKEIK